MFTPPRCPFPDCPSASCASFRYRKCGLFRRKCDGRTVQRFQCLHCARSFSTQTFRLDYRLKRPELNRLLLRDFVSKVTQRQSARTLPCNRKTVAHRLLLLGRHGRDFHRERLAEAAVEGRRPGVFQLDELESFEHERRLKPLTVPVLIERRTFFVVDAGVAPLPCRGGLSERHREKKAQLEALHGKRRSGSRRAVAGALRNLAEMTARDSGVELQTDCKSSYATLLAEIFRGRARHQRCSSRARRDYRCLLFPVNHTLAMLRDGLARLVRRTWATTKKAACLEAHLWIWIAWRNYVRGVTNQAPYTTPAMALGVQHRRWRVSELLASRILPEVAA